MKLVVLDGFTLNPGDLSWKGLQELADCTFYERTPADLTWERAQEAEAVITNKVVFDKAMIDKLPKLKYIGVSATGYNVIDLQAAKDHGIVVTNIPAYSADSVAQDVFALILTITNQVAHYAAEVSAGVWSRSKDFTYWDTPLLELHGKTIGIAGLGHNGMGVARIALAFGMQVIALTSKTGAALPEGIRAVTKEEFFKQSDIVTLHYPLTPETHHIINKETLALMKPSAILINTSRGPLVDEEALAEALNNKRLFAAGLDVMTDEPPAITNPLLKIPNCYITPHIAWATIEARTRLMNMLIQNFASYLKGTVINQVNR